VNPTAALLWEAARPAVRPLEVITAIKDGADTSRAARLACSHGLGPMLWRALSESGCVDALDDAATRDLTNDVGLRRAQTKLLLPKAVALAIEPLTAASLEPVVWKGPAIACRYPEPALRPMADIDMIVPAASHAEAVGVLQHAGWKAIPNHSRDHYDTGLVHPSLPGLPIELHFGLSSWRNRSNRLKSDELWERRRPITLFGTRAFGLSEADEVVAVAAHAGKPFHSFGRLIWATDLAIVAEGVDWRAVRERAIAADCRTVVAVGLRLAARLGADPPWWLVELPESRARRRALDEVLDPDWPADVDEEWFNLHDRLRYALTDRVSRAGILLAGEIIDAPPGKRVERMAETLRRAGRAGRDLSWSSGLRRS
jgi:hypothetical protein